MRIKSAVCLLVALWVMGCDAWFWSWSGTTTLAPAVDSEGSGGPEGSGEGPLENIATVGQEDIIDQTYRAQKILQTLDGTTAPQDETTVAPEDETTVAPEDETTVAPQDETTVAPPPTTTEAPKTAPAPRSIITPGNRTSLQKGTSSSEASGFLMYAGNVSGLGAKHESKLESGAGAGVWSDSGSGSRSESGVQTRPGTNWGSAPEIEIFKRSEEGENMEVDHRDSKVSQANGVRLDLQETSWLAHHKINEGGYVESSNFSPQSDRQSKTLETRSDVKNFTSRRLKKPASAAEVSESENANKLSLKAAGSPAGHRNSPRYVFKTSLALSPRQIATDASSPTATPEDLSSQLQVVVTELYVAPSKMTPTDNAPILTEVEPSQSSQFRQVALNMQEPTGGHHDPVDSTALAESPQCLLLESSLPFCSSITGQKFAVPNFLNQSSVEEVRVLLHDWAWLLNSKCHHSLELFFCLLLVPKCGTSVQMPCRSFCEVLKDSCWTLLDQGHLPVECQALPEEEKGGCQCLSVSNHKGNSWLK